MEDSILWYDLETSSSHTNCARILQFAAIRTDLHLQPVDDPIVVHGKLPPDILPEPGAIIKNGLNPGSYRPDALNEYELAEKIFAEITKPGTVTAGFNTLQFDDEILRQVFYRNFLPSYTRERRAQGTARWDILDLCRLVFSRDPDAMAWPTRDDGSPSFRLEDLAAENQISHTDAHTALPDVNATLEIARILKLRSPDWYDYYWEMRKGEQVEKVIGKPLQHLLEHFSGLHTGPNTCSTKVAVIGRHPTNKNQFLAVSVSQELQPYMELDSGQLRDCVFGSKRKKTEYGTLRAFVIKANAVPAIARVDMPTTNESHALQLLRDSPQFVKRIASTFSDDFPINPDCEDQLYGGSFLQEEELRKCRSYVEARTSFRQASTKGIKDVRLKPLLGRVLYRNFPDTLSVTEMLAAQKTVSRNLVYPTIQGTPSAADFFDEATRQIKSTQESQDTVQLLRGIIEFYASKCRAAAHAVCDSSQIEVEMLHIFPSSHGVDLKISILETELWISYYLLKGGPKRFCIDDPHGEIGKDIHSMLGDHWSAIYDLERGFVRIMIRRMPTKDTLFLSGSKTDPIKLEPRIGSMLTSAIREVLVSSHPFHRRRLEENISYLE